MTEHTPAIKEKIGIEGKIELATYEFTPDLTGLTKREMFDIITKREPQELTGEPQHHLLHGYEHHARGSALGLR